MNSLFLHSDFVGERLIYGEIGEIGILVSFTFSLFACFFFYKTFVAKATLRSSYEKTGRVFFIIQSCFLFCSGALLLVIITRHYFEYKYVWQHSSKDLSPKYLLSSLWEGQEGSFLLWAFWNALIGLVLLFRKAKNYAPALVFISLFQVMLDSMLLGIKIGTISIGSSPFILMRHFFADAPIFQQANYLSFISDGKGLNELLQNYWMVIHPPVLFLGFGLCIVPFAYASIALWTKEYMENLKEALKWGLVAAAVLGLGIMMGGAWAYESLSFGGYWAWDPVENASLVPWLFLVTAIHSCLISLKKNASVRSTILFFACGFIFVLYSTYLTRSGILGDSSAHSFTDLEMGTQLILILCLSVLPFFILLFKNWHALKIERDSASEDALSSKEFWLSIGALVVFFSSVYISISTSLPVVNKIIGTDWALGSDVEFSYNRTLILAAIFVLALSCVGYYLKFKKTSRDYLKSKLLWPLLGYAIASLVITIFIGFDYRRKGDVFLAFIYASFFVALTSVFLHIHYYIFISKKKIGGPLSHLGFATLILGVLLSSANKKVLSHNYTGFIQDFGKESKENPMENITLIKDVPIPMPPYTAIYKGDSTHPSDKKRYFVIQFIDSARGETFYLYPNAYVNLKGAEGLMSNPDKKHYLLGDVFAYVTSIPNTTPDEESIASYSLQIKNGDTIDLSLGYLVARFENNAIRFTGKDSYAKEIDTSVSLASLRFLSLSSIHFTTLNTTLVINRPKEQSELTSFSILVKENTSPLPYVTLKVYFFPFINIVWIGAILLFIGFMLSAVERRKKTALKKI